MACLVIEKGTPNAHQRIQKWRQQNVNGFMLNCVSPRAVVLHTTMCPHFGRSEWEEGLENWGTLGSATKVLAPTRQELVDWATRKKSAIRRCSDCKN